MAQTNNSQIVNSFWSSSYTGSNGIVIGNANLQLGAFPNLNNFFVMSNNLEDTIVNADLAAWNFSLGLQNSLRFPNFLGGGHAVFIPAGSGPTGAILGGVTIWNDGYHLQTVGTDGNTQTLLGPPYTGATGPAGSPGPTGSAGATRPVTLFRAVATSSQNCTSTEQQVTFNDYLYDTNNIRNPASSSATIPYTGVYSVQGSVGTDMSFYTYVSLSIYVNSAQVALTMITAPDSGGQVSTTLQLVPNDVVQLWVGTNSGGSFGTDQYGTYGGVNIFAELNITEQPPTTFMPY